MILVTGANGFLGSWVVKRLLQQSEKVRILVRSTSDLTELNGLSFEKAVGDVTDLKSLVPALEGVDSVFHLAGLISYFARDLELMKKINVEGTRNILEAASLARVKRFLHTSSVMAVGAGFDDSKIFDEKSTFNLKKLKIGYADTKLEAENIVRDFVKNKKIEAVIVNPSTAYGAGDARKGSRKNQVKAAQGRQLFYPNGGVNIVPVENCVDGMIRAWQNGRPGDRYILSSSNIRLSELFQKISELAGSKPPQLQMPNLLIHGLGIFADAADPFGIKINFGKERAWVATLFHWFSSEKAQKELGFTPGDSDLALKKSVEWMTANGYLDRK